MSDAVTADVEACSAARAARRAVTRITSDSRQVQPGDAFVAYPGENARRARLHPATRSRAARARAVGAAGASRGSPRGASRNAPVDDLQAARSARSPTPSTASRRALWMVGVTGTNGKTSCATGRAGARRSSAGARRRWARSATACVGALEPPATPRPTPRCCRRRLRDFVRAARASRGDGSLVARPRPGPRQRRDVRRCAVHQPHARPSRLPRHDGAPTARPRRGCSSWPGLSIARDQPRRCVRPQPRRRLARRRAARSIELRLRRRADVVRRVARSRSAMRSGISFAVATPWGEARSTSRWSATSTQQPARRARRCCSRAAFALDAALAASAASTPVPGRMQRLGGDDAAAGRRSTMRIRPTRWKRSLAALRPAVARRAASWSASSAAAATAIRGKRPLMGAHRGAARRSRGRHRATTRAAKIRARSSSEIVRRHAGQRQSALRRRARPRRGDRAAMRDARAGRRRAVAGKGHETYQERDGERHPFSDARARGARAGGAERAR